MSTAKLNYIRGLLETIEKQQEDSAKALREARRGISDLKLIDVGPPTLEELKESGVVFLGSNGAPCVEFYQYVNFPQPGTLEKRDPATGTQERPVDPPKYIARIEQFYPVEEQP